MLSITFRKLSPERIVELTTQAGLDAIEWGGDVHVSHGDTDAARRARTLTADAGLAVSAYGSYYRAGVDEGPDIEAVLDSCEALGATKLRVWAGRQGSAESDDAKRAAVNDDLRQIAVLAQSRGVTVALEYHVNTLTDDLASVQRLLRDVDHPNVKLFWQPPNGMPAAQALAELNQVKPDVLNLHVFHWLWENDGVVRRPLDEGQGAWQTYFDAVDEPGVERFASLEFVKDDSVDQFLADAAALRGWLEPVDA